MSWTLYPLSWVAVAVVYGLAASGDIDLNIAPTILGAVLIALYMIMERIIPYQQRWQMTWNTFLSDIKYLIANGALGAVIGAALSFFTITAAGQSEGFASHWPFLVQLVLCVLIYDGLNYAIHRAMHEAPGLAGKWLWSIHLAHHMPAKVYVLMHAVFHPLNVLINAVIVVTLPIWLMGYDPHVVTMFFLINSMHGLISHFNVDVRMGWMNYIFIGTELHRYHHSADIAEAKNYAALTSVYDQLLGTFVYRPGRAPEALGVKNDKSLPRYGEYLKVLALPFK